MIWPSDAARDLVPSFTVFCATPTAPDLFFMLNEEAAWASELQSAAFGILHRNDQALATFRVARVRDASQLSNGSAPKEATTTVGDLRLVWARAGDHVAVAWLDANDIVDVSAEGADAAAAAAQAWLAASGHEGNVTPPERIPEVTDMPPALDVGPPVDSLPEGYSALVVNPFAFMASDFADFVTIHRVKGLKALGAAIVVSEEGALIGTMVASVGGSLGLGEYGETIEGNGSKGVVGEGFDVSDADALVVGYEREEVTTFTTAWEQAIADRNEVAHGRR
jgi:hypothetical protein